MIEKFCCTNGRKVIRTDLACEFPIYLYVESGRRVWVSKNIKQLLDSDFIKKPLQTDERAISHLLQSGLVPPPRTVYKNLYILGLGDSAIIDYREDGQVILEFEHDFPFKRKGGREDDFYEYGDIKEKLRAATLSRVDPIRKSFLFHSAGKDSNSLAVALADSELKDKLTLVTHKSKDGQDESKLSSEIARKLFLSHSMLEEVERLTETQIEKIKHFYREVPFPCVDNISLNYVFYFEQMPEMKGANIVDGGGNDSYMLVMPSPFEKKMFFASTFLSKLSFLRRWVNSESPINRIVKNKSEWCGVGGLSYRDSKKIFPKCRNVASFWQTQSKRRRDLNEVEFKSDILTSMVAAEVHIRKVRNACDAYGANLILPFTDSEVSDFFFKMSDECLYNVDSGRNKVVLREFLKHEISLDSDKIGKKGWEFNNKKFMEKNLQFVKSEIFKCKIWEGEGLREVFARLEKNAFKKSGRISLVSSRYIYSIFLLSLWFNNSKYAEGPR